MVDGFLYFLLPFTFFFSLSSRLYPLTAFLYWLFLVFLEQAGFFVKLVYFIVKFSESGIFLFPVIVVVPLGVEFRDFFSLLFHPGEIFQVMHPFPVVIRSFKHIIRTDILYI